MQPDFSQIGPYLLAALVMFAVYRRLRRSFGRQALRPARLTLRIVVLAVLACSMLPLALRSVQFLAAEFSGAVFGLGLGIWGAQRTRFVMHDGQMHYVPHTYTGIAVSLLFVGRLAYRLVQIYTGGHAPHGGADPSRALAGPSMLKSPLTVGILFVLVGYYVCYYAWLLWKSKRLTAADIDAATAATTP
jgi:hypothetical protein